MDSTHLSDFEVYFLFFVAFLIWLPLLKWPINIIIALINHHNQTLRGPEEKEKKEE